MFARSARLLLMVCALLAACRTAIPEELAVTTLPTPSAPSPDRPPAQAVRATLPPTAQFTPTSQPASTPTPTEAPLAAPITANNAAALSLALEIRFQPWELVLALAWSPDGSLLAVSAGDAIHLYRAGSFEESLAIIPGVWSTALAFDRASARLASAGRDGSISVWSASSGALLHTRLAHKKGANAVAFSPDGLLLASGGNDAIARLWDAASGEARGQMIGGTYAVPALAFDPAGAGVAIVNGSVIRWREAASTRILRSLYAQDSIYTLAYNPSGDRLATGDSAGQVQVWDGASSQLLYTALHHPGATSATALIWKLAFSPDGSVLISAGGDGRLQLWQAADGAPLASLEAHSLAASSASFSPDGLWLASGGLDGVVRLWQSRP